MPIKPFMLLVVVVAAISVFANPIPTSLSLTLRNASISPSNAALFRVSNTTTKAFVWSSIGLAVFTALLQGLVTALAQMTESSNKWTFRFRLAKVEHIWWTIVSVLLMISLVLITLSFLSGSNNDSLSILALSSATFLTIVRYLLPAWESRHYIHNRWRAWTGPSRTGIARNKIAYCGGREDWLRLARLVKIQTKDRVPSDRYGWHLRPLTGIEVDPTDILNEVNSTYLNPLKTFVEPSNIYNDGYIDGDKKNPKHCPTVSLLWGLNFGEFQPRASRAVASMPYNLLRSQPFTTDGYAGRGLCLAMGILGRNKGVKPTQLVFKMTQEISDKLEVTSIWEPRPGKVLRSYYTDTLTKQYSKLGVPYLAAAIELSLILVDAKPAAVAAWLDQGLEQQNIVVNRCLVKLDATTEELRAHYESSYVSMIISLNHMGKKEIGLPGYERYTKALQRPDIICLGLLLKARGLPEPLWWNNSSDIISYRHDENACLDKKYQDSMAKLLGLAGWPAGFEDGIWDGEIRNGSEVEETREQVQLNTSTDSAQS